MKMLLLCVLAAALLGCHAEKAPNTAGADPTESTPAEPQPAAPSTTNEPQNSEPLPMDEVKYYYREKRAKDENMMKRYEDAKSLIVEKYNVKEELSIDSRHLGDWFAIVFKTPERDPQFIATDEPNPRPAAYMVNLQSRQIIDEGDWRSVKPLFEAMFEIYDKSSGEKQKDIAEQMAMFASVVAFRHPDYLSVIEGQKFPPGVGDAIVSRGMDKSELVYFITPRGGMVMFYTKCILRLDNNGLTFESSIYHPE